MDPFKPLNSVTKATFNQCSTYMRSANRPACLLETFKYRRRRERARSELKNPGCGAASHGPFRKIGLQNRVT